MRVKKDFFDRVSFKLGNGQTIRFWEDTGLGNSPLMDQYPILYNIVRHQNVSIHDVMDNAPPINISFRRALVGNKWELWSHLCLRLMHFTLSDDTDCLQWKLTQNGIFTVKSMYEDLMNGHTRYLQKYLWKIKMPLKIKVFMWFLHRKVLLTKDNLARRNWHGCSRCSFCGSPETVEHLFI